MRDVWAALAVSLALGGCAGGGATPTTDAVSVQTLPPNYRLMIAEHVRRSFFDPYSIRDAAISQPISGAAFTGPVLTVCVQANAKNRMGAYTGIKATSFTFREGQISVADTEYAGITCAQAVYESFPELEAGYKPPAPAKPAKRT